MGKVIGIDLGTTNSCVAVIETNSTSDKLDVPANITLMSLPPKSPELNPVENVWQYLRQNWLSNRVFETYDDIIDDACEAWNKLTALPTSSDPSECVIGPMSVSREGRWYYETCARIALDGAHLL